MKQSFGQRMGLIPQERPLQLGRIDEVLRTAIWNIYFLEVIPFFEKKALGEGYHSDTYRNGIILGFWADHWELSAENMPNSLYGLGQAIKNRIASDPWFVVFELIEFTTDLIGDVHFASDGEQFRKRFNSQFEKYNSAYRFVADSIGPITNQQEIEEIELALSNVRSFTMLQTCNEHLTKSVAFLSNLESPDYSNSVKESVSAIEALSKILANDKNATLGVAIKKLQKSIGLHQALASAIEKIYGYSCEKPGVRHGHIDADETDFDEAKFLLVTNSSIINFLIAKADKKGLLSK